MTEEKKPEPRPDFCRCVKEPGIYGMSGWHWRRNPDWPDEHTQDVAFERCPAYAHAVAEAAGKEKVI